MSHDLPSTAGRRVLVAAGRVQLVAHTAYLLARDGCRIDTAFTGADALEMLQRHCFDLLVMGSAFPDLGALEVLRRALLIRGAKPGQTNTDQPVATLVLVESQKPGATLTEREERDAAGRIAALVTGADDALTSPFPDEELRLRAAALLRHPVRPAAPTAQASVTLGPLCVNLDAVEVTVNGCRASLTRTEFRLLHALVRRPGTWLTKAELGRAVWQGGEAPSTRALIVHVSRLRGKLAASGIDIEAATGRGYRIRVPLRVSSRAGSAARPDDLMT